MFSPYVPRPTWRSSVIFERAASEFWPPVVPRIDEEFREDTPIGTISGRSEFGFEEPTLRVVATKGPSLVTASGDPCRSLEFASHARKT
jgi:hypothetical protein